MRIHCRCGSVEIDVLAEPIAQFFCHCDDCQAVHGAAYVPESVYPAKAIRIVKGEPVAWTLKRNPRYFCRDCGTRLFIDVTAVNVRGLNGYLLPTEAFNPQYHMQCQFAVRPVPDELPHYTSLSPQFGGPDETIGW